MADASDPKPGDRFVLVADIPILFPWSGATREFRARIEVTVQEVLDDEWVKLQVNRVDGVPRGDRKQITQAIEGWQDIDDFEDWRPSGQGDPRETLRPAGQVQRAAQPSFAAGRDPAGLALANTPSDARFFCALLRSTRFAPRDATRYAGSQGPPLRFA